MSHERKKRRHKANSQEERTMTDYEVQNGHTVKILSKVHQTRFFADLHCSLRVWDAMTSQRPPSGCHSSGTYRLRWRRHSPFRHRRRRSRREVAGPGTPTFKVNPGPSGYWQSNNEPLVNIQTTMENHNVCLMAKSTISMTGKHATNYGTSPFWHQLFPFSIVVCMLTRG